MSKIKNQTEISGVFGESISFRKVNGRVVAKNRPQRSVGKLSTAQIEHQEKFQEAADYAGNQMNDKKAKALYASGITAKRQTAYSLAVRDYLVAPTVKEIDSSNYFGAIGDIIVAKAVDDFMVTKVMFAITDSSGATIERGLGKQDPQMNFLWEYKATVANATLPGTTITATAYDLPRNKATLEIVL